MRRLKVQRGFTIIETLIFLSVSSLVFTAGISQYTRQQHEVEFRQAVRSLQSQLQSMINEVAVSYPPDIKGYSCTADAANNPIVFTPTSVAVDNSSCIFLGRALGVGNDTNCTLNVIDKCSRYSDIPIAARREFFTGGQGAPVTSLAEAKPIALATCLTNDDGLNSIPCGSNPLSATRTARPDLATRAKFKGFIGVYDAFVRNKDGSANTSIGGIAFLLDLNASGASAGNNVNLVRLPTPFLNNTESRVTDAIDVTLGSANAVTEAGFTNPLYGVTLCIIGSYGQKAAISIGANNSQLDVQVENDSTKDSGCA